MILAVQIVGLFTGLLALANLCILAIRPLRERFLGTASIREGQRCTLRAYMLSTYYKHHDNDRIRQYEYENFILMYKAYKALGGNSFIDRIYAEVMTWEVET